MDRRQKKTRNSIFSAFIKLLDKKDFNSITVQEIIDEADIGRATFYAHFETKDFLLKELCEELFSHIICSASNEINSIGLYAKCNEKSSIFLHLLHHLQNNDENILLLLSGQNNELFLNYFKESLKAMIINSDIIAKTPSVKKLPKDFVVNIIATTFVETVTWWIHNQMKESPETIEDYFLNLMQELITVAN